MLTIHKYKLKPFQHFQTLPKGAKFLCVQIQFNEPQMWFEVNTDEPTENREFIFYGTGHPMLEGYTHDYLGTFHLNGGALVFHVYELLS